MEQKTMAIKNNWWWQIGIWVDVDDIRGRLDKNSMKRWGRRRKGRHVVVSIRGGEEDTIKGR